MKRILYQMISLLLTLCLCGTLAGCGGRDVGGIGKISMEDSDSSSGGLNPLGEPNQPTSEQTPAPQDPQTPASSDTGEYAIFASEKQDFSFLYNSSYAAVWSDENGATIYTEEPDSIPYLLVFRTVGNTAGFDVQEAFEVETEDMRARYGTDLISVGDYQDYTVSGKPMSGVLYTYTVQEYTVEMLELVEITSDSIIQYTCKYLQGKSDATMSALVEAAASYQPSANYYANQSETVPADTPTENTSFATEEYNNGKISMTIPAGWKVDHYFVDKVTWGVQVTDPQNPDRMLIYHSAMTPFFVSEASRQVWANRVNARYASAPVAPNPSAGAMLGLWQTLIDYMKLEGAPVALPALENISLQSDDKVSGPYASYGGIESQAVATCTGPSGSDCVIVLSNAFVLIEVPIMDNIAPNYYTAYGNYAVLLPADQMNVNLKAMVDCVTSVKLLNQDNRNSFSASDGLEYPLKAPEFNTDITIK